MIKQNNGGNDHEDGKGHGKLDQNLMTERMGFDKFVKIPKSKIETQMSLRSDTVEMQTRDFLVTASSIDHRQSQPAHLDRIEKDIAELRMLILQQNQMNAGSPHRGSPSPLAALAPSSKKKRIKFSDIPEEEEEGKVTERDIADIKDIMNAMSKQLLTIQRQLNENGKRDKGSRRKMDIPLIRAPESMRSPETPNEITPRVPSHGRNNVAPMDDIDIGGILKR